MVSIAAFQAVDPGSIPGHRSFFRSAFLFLLVQYLQFDGFDFKTVNNFKAKVETQKASIPFNWIISINCALTFWLGTKPSIKQGWASSSSYLL